MCKSLTVLICYVVAGKDGKFSFFSPPSFKNYLAALDLGCGTQDVFFLVVACGILVP